jgi:hypothetical protein
MTRSPPLSLFPDAVRVRHPWCISGDHHTFVLRMDLVPHHLQALCAFPLHLTSGTARTFTVSQDLFSSTSITPFFTVCAALMMTSQYVSAITRIDFWQVIAVIVSYAFLFTIILWMSARSVGCQSTLLITDAIPWSLLVSKGTV